MSTLALVYIDATKHIVSSVLIQSGYSTPPKVEDLVGTGLIIRHPGLNIVSPAINVDPQAVALKVLLFDAAYFTSNRAMLDGLLSTPLNYYLHPKDDQNSPLV